LVGWLAEKGGGVERASERGGMLKITVRSSVSLCSGRRGGERRGQEVATGEPEFN
jgi:hypothetical protein